MKKAKRMIALLVALAVVALANVFVNTLTATKDSTVQEETGAFKLTEYEKDDVIGLEWKNAEESVSFMLEEGVWIYPADKAFPVNQDEAKSLLDAAMKITADRKYDSVETFDEYGLDIPAFALTLTFSDKNKVTYSLGAQTPFEDGYYVSVSGQNESVYVVSDDFSGDFGFDLYDFAQMEALPELGQVTELSIGEAFKAEYFAESVTADKNQHWYSALTQRAMDAEKVESLLESVSSLAFDAVINHNASDDELGEYALTNESAICIYVKDDAGNEKTILAGKAEGDGKYYARLPDSRMVYTLSGNPAAILSADENNMRLLSIAPVAFEDLSEIVLSAQNAGCIIVREEITQTATDCDAQEQTIVIKRDGTQTDGVEEERIWTLISALQATDFVESEQADGEILSVGIRTNTEKTLEFTVYEYDPDSYFLSVSDGRKVLVKADEIDKIIRYIKQFG